MKFIELFAGIGGFRKGLEEVGGFDCVYTNEFNKYAAQIYERNYEKPDTRDIREVPAEEIPDHELLTAGFPCQAFSIAGKRGGFEDTRGTLFFEIARIAKQKQPRLLLLENVKGLLSHESGKTFGTILNTLDELGYDLQWQVLNSKDFGVPQNRERVFIIGHLRGTSRPEVFPLIRGNGTNAKELTKGVGQADRVYDIHGSSPTIPTSGGGRHEPKVAIYPVLTPDRENKRQNGRRFKTNGEPSFTLTGQDIHGVAINNNGILGNDGYGTNMVSKRGDYYRSSINANNSDSIRVEKRTTCDYCNTPKYTHSYCGEAWVLGGHLWETGTMKDYEPWPESMNEAVFSKVLDLRKKAFSPPISIRRLTPTECERLQGFPDGWTDGVSDTQRYKCLGNAVTTNVITAIGEGLI